MSETQIQLRIRDTEGNEDLIRVTTSDPFQGMMTRYAEQTGQPHENITFTYGGTRLMSTSTAHELNMTDNDLIVAETAPSEPQHP
ncbi:sumo domain-containing protein [Streptomyces sp. NPDC051561]|uniref:sumo domain-containing protein n=1 Tax=Streptomyces sp. NPDC051561 TaxID=3365658 RepID=UPI0037910288